MLDRDDTSDTIDNTKDSYDTKDSDDASDTIDNVSDGSAPSYQRWMGGSLGHRDTQATQRGLEAGGSGGCLGEGG